MKYEAEAQFVAERIEALLGEPAMIRQGRICVRFDPGILSSYSVPQAAAPGITAGLWRPVAFRCLREQGAAFWTPARRRCSGHFSRFWTIRSRTFHWRRFWPARCFDLRRITWGASGRACPEGALFEALTRAGETGDTQAGAFLDLVQSLRQVARLENLTRLLEEIYARTHMEAVFAAMDGGEKRRRNLEFLYETAASFEQGGRRDLAQFLAFWIRLPRGDSSRRKQGACQRQ